MKQIIKNIKEDKNFFRLLIIFFLVLIIASLLNPKLFLTVYNFKSMAKQFPEFGIISIGIGLTLLLEGIDLSLISIANLSAVFAATFMLHFVPENTLGFTFFLYYFPGIIIVSVVTGALAGMLNGLLITKIGIPAILATLGTQQLFTGLAIVYTKGKAISGLPLEFSTFMLGDYLWGIPNILVIFIIIVCGVGFFLSKTTFGKSLYLIGTNEQAAEYAGIKKDKLVSLTYTISGILASLAGLIMMGKTNSIKADYGTSYILQCILIAVLGGFSPKGGKGNIQGIIIAVLILQFLSTSLNMFPNVSNFYRDLIWGGLLLMVLLVNYYIDQQKA